VVIANFEMLFWCTKIKSLMDNISCV
jgi:hypothetical protein